MPAAEPTPLEATALSEKSKLESSHSLAFRKMQKSSTTNDYPALVAAYQQIAADSVYYPRATELRARESVAVKSCSRSVRRSFRSISMRALRSPCACRRN